MPQRLGVIRIGLSLAAALLCPLCFADEPATRVPATGSGPPHALRRPHPTPSTTQQAGPAGGASEEPKPVVSEHELKLEQGTLRYTATAGFIPLKDAAGKPRAKVFYISYQVHADDEPAQRDRPITFVFNGGPGAAAIWLHLGTAGPRRVDVPEDGSIPSPPYRLKDNPFTWLDFTDLVFIDPVGTGYSRAEPEHDKEFYSVNGDIASVADVIRIYLTEQQRWPSPKFLAGESYGTTRAAGLSEYLHDRYGIDASGIVLMSTVLNFQTLEFRPGNDTPYPLWLPSYTAAAWYHKKLGQDLQAKDLPAVVAEAQKWAFDEYMPALLRGSSREKGPPGPIEEGLARYTGLPMEYITKADLRIPPNRFEKALLNDGRRVIGRMDARITGHDVDPLGDSPEFDPSLTGYVGVFSGCFNDYIRRELHFESDLPYEFLSPNVGPWDFGHSGGYLNISTTLRSAITKVPSMKVRICSGYFDLATPFTAADYTANQLALGELRGNITQSYYEGGHMLYLNHPALVKLHEDLREFYRAGGH